MTDDINDPTWLTQRAATEIVRYAVDAVCEKTQWLFRPPAKVDRTFSRQAASPAFARAMSDRLTRLVEVDGKTISGAHALSDLAATLLEGAERTFSVRLFAAMSVAFDYALRRRLSAGLEWLDPWHAWKYFLPTPTSPRDEDYVVMCAQLSGLSAFALADEMLGDSPVMVVDTLRRIASALRAPIQEFAETHKNAGVEALVRAFDERQSATNLQPYNRNIARAAMVYIVTGQCFWGREWANT